MSVGLCYEKVLLMKKLSIVNLEFNLVLFLILIFLIDLVLLP